MFDEDKVLYLFIFKKKNLQGVGAPCWSHCAPTLCDYGINTNVVTILGYKSRVYSTLLILMKERKPAHLPFANMLNANWLLFSGDPWLAVRGALFTGVVFVVKHEKMFSSLLSSRVALTRGSSLRTFIQSAMFVAVVCVCVFHGVRPQSAVSSYVSEFCTGQRVHVCLFTREDEPPRCSSSRDVSHGEVALFLRNLAHGANGRFHWITDTGRGSSSTVM